MNTISFDQFALRAGKQAYETREAAEPLHKAYKGADPEQQSDLRARWMLNHMTGQVMARTKCDEPTARKAAERILSKGKGKGATKEAINGIDRAYSDFRYHIVRPNAKPASSARVRVPAAVRAAAMTFLGEFEGDTLDKQIDAAIAALRAMKS